MRLWVSVAAVATLTVGLAACGGGGGGGSAAGGSGGAAVPDSKAPVPLTLSVKVNGAATSADSSGAYAIKPGDAVEIVPSQSVSWATASSLQDAIKLIGASASGTQWTATVVNTDTSVVSYTISAKDDANTQAANAVLKVAGGDARNGNYKAFATNGTRQTLALNFDVGTYTWTDATNAVLAGKFAADPSQAGTYVFQSARITTLANTARFRVNQDTVIGAFPFAVTQSATEAYAIQPFLASRALEIDQATLDGVYNRFAIDVGPNSQTSDISQFRISDGGTKLVRCNSKNIDRIELCQISDQQTWLISPGSVSGMWTMTEAAAPTNTANIAFARIGTEKVFLIAGKSLSDPRTAVFRVGVPEGNAWPAGTGYGSATPGSWGRVDIAAGSTSTRTGIATDGSVVQTANTYYAMGLNQPAGMRQLYNANTGATYFAMQGAKIFAIVGANDPLHGTNGYLQLSLMD